jgi:hypothetical protein
MDIGHGNHNWSKCIERWEKIQTFLHDQYFISAVVLKMCEYLSTPGMKKVHFMIFRSTFIESIKYLMITLKDQVHWTERDRWFGSNILKECEAIRQIKLKEAIWIMICRKFLKNLIFNQDISGLIDETVIILKDVNHEKSIQVESWLIEVWSWLFEFRLGLGRIQQQFVTNWSEKLI